MVSKWVDNLSSWQASAMVVEDMLNGESPMWQTPLIRQIKADSTNVLSISDKAILSRVDKVSLDLPLFQTPLAVNKSNGAKPRIWSPPPSLSAMTT